MAGLTEEEMAKVKGFMHPDLVADSRCETWIAMAQFRVGRCYFGAAFPYALALMASHIGAIEGRGSDGDAGRIASKKEGDISVSYASGSSGDDGDLSSTSWGQQYLALLKQYSVRPGVTGRVNFRRFCGGAKKVL